MGDDEFIPLGDIGKNRRKQIRKEKLGRIVSRLRTGIKAARQHTAKGLDLARRGAVKLEKARVKVGQFQQKAEKFSRRFDSGPSISFGPPPRSKKGKKKKDFNIFSGL